MIIKHSINAYSRPRKNNPSNLGLFLRLTMNKSRKEFGLSYTIDKNEWDSKNHRVINRPDAQIINSNIEECKRVLTEIVARYELIERRIPEIDEIAEEYYKQTGKKKEDKPKRVVFAYEYIDNFILWGKKVKGWGRSTSKKFITLQNNLKLWKENLVFDEIDDNLLHDFQKWCENILGYRNTTLQKQSGFLRWWLSWAKDEGLYNGTSGETFRPKYKGGDFQFKEIIYLDQYELTQLEKFDFSESLHLDHARDLFVFSCYCGLRFSDVVKLRKGNIINGRIYNVTVKTADRLAIPLNKHTKRIIAKYSNSFKDGRILPVMSNQKVNDYIKECCKAVGIDQEVIITYYVGNTRVEEIKKKYEVVSFHAARRTFITLAFDLGIPTEVIMKFSGHKKIEMLKPYMDIMEKKKRNEMSKFDTI